MPDSLTKYVNLHGPCEIKVRGIVNAKDETGRLETVPDAVELELYFYDEQAKNILNAKDPLFLTVKIDGGRLKFLRSTILAELSEEGFKDYEKALGILVPGMNWETAEDPTPETMPNMNPIKTPPPPPKEDEP